jgi:import inner membrane translocase subunit TIM16
MNRDEAKKILGVSGYDSQETLMMYKKLFELNDPAKGGSFYLQCKVLGAMETLNSKDK